MNTSLPTSPSAVVDEAGKPRFGTYQGPLPVIELARVRGPHQPAFPATVARHKRWLYTLVATPEVIALCAISDLGYIANAFVQVVDLKEKKAVLDESWLVPPGPHAKVGDRPSEGLAARFVGMGCRLSNTRALGQERFHQSLQVGQLLPYPSLSLSWKGELLAAGAPPPLTVIAEVPGGGVNVTQKWAGLLAFGALEAKGRRYVLDGGVGGMDFTQGFLPRHCTWRWAFACGRLADGTPVGLNLVEGFNETGPANENALWLGGKLYPLDRTRFTFRRDDVLEPWQVETVDGAVKLTLKPLSAHYEKRDLKVVKSHYAQPVGLFSGTLRVGGVTHAIEALPGVAEDQDMLW